MLLPALIALSLLALPIVEIAMFIVVGSYIGVLPTIGLILASSIAGVMLLRLQGLGNLARLRSAMERGDTPTGEVADGAMILLAGLLLITPGFITGALGLLLFIPQVRKMFWKLAGFRLAVVATRRGGPNVVDLDRNEYYRETRRQIDHDD
ncbi:MAG: FxsA family protein [Rhizobiaceae bacterium]|nr:FxsA family protein [Rhizobiaceae bacterium]